MPRFPAILLVAALATSGGGQPPGGSKGDPKPPPKDPQAVVEPRGEPGEGQKFLAKFVGTWAVEKSFTAPGRPATKATGECVQSMEHGGRFLRSEFVFAGTAGKTTGTGVIGYDPATGLFTSVWYDSRQTRMSVRQSKERFDGKRIVLEAAGVDGPPARRSRTETTLEGGGDRIVHRQYNPAADGKENLLMELVLTRKPAPR